MAKREFDPIDWALGTVLVITGFIMVNVASFSLFGLDFGAEVFSMGPASISTAYALSAAALVGTIATNDNAELSNLKSDVENLDQMYKFAVIGMAALMVGWLFIPQIPSFFQSGDIWGVLFVSLTGVGQFALGWML